MNKQRGSTILITLVMLFVLGLLAFYVYQRYQESDTTPKQNTEEVIDKAKDNVDKANEAQEKANELIDIIN